jgi:hypothetical protein
MAEDGKPGTNLASGSVVLVALIATGAFVFHKDAPLTGSRPAITEATVREPAESQTVDARLWQDPFAAVAKAIDRLAKDERGQQCRKTGSFERSCSSPITAEEKNALVIGVTLSAAPYAEESEQRRRTRYAVLSGLERAGFAPRDARHIGYFWLGKELPTDTPNKTGSLATSTLKPLPNSGTNIQLPLLTHPRLVTLLEQYAPPAEPAATDPGQYVPYEWFDGSDHTKRILVLWLEEDNLKHHPFKEISNLKVYLQLQEDQKLKIIGPYTSGILRDMVNEGCSFDKNNQCDLLNDVQFYPYGASAPDKQILGKAGETVEDYFGKLNIKVQRTIGTDDRLAEGVKTELELRKARVGPDKGDGDLALISEWDTFYGQTLPKAVEDAFGADKCNGGSACEWIHKVTYLRGLDGLTPMTGGTDERKHDKPAAQGETQAGAAGFFKTSTDVDNLDRPVGQGQFDYLRRMSKDLHKKNDDLQKNGRSIKVIGVLGSDVFDKLLVLRALRPEFPEALFFTTDFDESYTIGSELPWTRNLIITSSFGPTLNEKIQGEIPSFRNSYQTSAFLATLAAIGDPADKWETPQGFSNYVTKQLTNPRIFEISRSGNVFAFKRNIESVPASSSKDPTHKREECLGCEDAIAANGALITGRSEGDGRAQHAKKGCDRSPHPWYCNEIQPDDENLFPIFADDGRKLLVCGLAGAALLGLALLCLGKVPVNARIEVAVVVVGLGVGALTAYYWKEFAVLVTSHGEGEPIAVLEGVSVWPTVLLRLLGIIVSVYFIWRAQNSLHKNLVEIASEMKLSLADGAVTDRHTKERYRKRIGGVFLSIRDTIMSVFFDFSLGQSGTDQNASLNVETAWKAYICQERFCSRFWRASLYTLLMFLFFMYVLVPMLGHPSTPTRGPIAFNIYMLTTRLDVIFMLFLTFFVFDATCFCLLFVNKLRRAKSEWPNETRGDFKRRLRLQTDLINDWIDLEFVAQRTRCIGWLIYYPFVLIALLILSRTTVFANYAPSATILVAQGISLSIVFGCAIMLWWTATAARDAAKRHLTDEIIWAKGLCTEVIVDTTAPHVELIANKDASEQPASPPIRVAQQKAAAADPPQQENGENNPRYAEQLETLLTRVEQLRDGAFGPFTQQPLVKAVILPVSSFGWTALIESGLLHGL